MLNKVEARCLAVLPALRLPRAATATRDCLLPPRSAPPRPLPRRRQLPPPFLDGDRLPDVRAPAFPILEEPLPDASLSPWCLACSLWR